MRMAIVSRQIVVAAVLVAIGFVLVPFQSVLADDDPTYGRPPSPDCILLVTLYKTMPKKDYQRYVRQKTLEGWTRERGVTAGAGHFGRIWLCPPPPDQPASVQTLPVLPFSFGLGHRDHGDDRFQK
jgi:hypothetical protein